MYPDLNVHFPYSNSQPMYAKVPGSVPTPSAPSAAASTNTSHNVNLTTPSVVDTDLSLLLDMTGGVQGGVLEAVCAELDNNYSLSDVGEAHIDFSSVQNMFGPAAASQAHHDAGTMPSTQGSDASTGVSH
jgi:hypothetical protein